MLGPNYISIITVYLKVQVIKSHPKTTHAFEIVCYI